MRILLLSDTHSYIDDAILRYAETVDAIWHAGDIGDLAVTDALQKIKPLTAVYGNIDNAQIRRTFPLDVFSESEGVRIWMTHIGGYPGHFDKRVRERLISEHPDLFVCGHSHILRVMRDAQTGTLCLNPGAAGVHGFHHMRTMLRFELYGGKVENMEVIELGKRGALHKK
ncbi:MAG: metallophosphoesterase family protein [Chitinophagales bacterium]